MIYGQNCTASNHVLYWAYHLLRCYVYNKTFPLPLLLLYVVTLIDDDN